MSIPNDPLGAFCRDNHVAVQGAGSGPLAGLGFGVKDVFHIAGARTGFGQPDWLRTHEPATATASAVQQLLDAGANMLGKTHTDELAYSLTGENVHYGTPLNPRDPARIPGGSSNGSAAAVAGGLADFALGTDCGGSVRLPASYCGIAGIRPTHGRVSLAGVIPFGPSFDVAGWFARDAELLARVGQVLLGEDAAQIAAPTRLVRLDDAFDLVDRDVAESLAPAVAAVSALLGDSGAIAVSDTDLWQWFETFRVIQAFEVWGNHGEWVSATSPQLGPGIRERFDWAAGVGAAQAQEQRARRAEIVARLDRLLQPGEVWCLPTSPRIAPRRGTPTSRIEIEYRNQAMCLLCIAGLGGLPQINLPLAQLDGLPLGLSIVGARGSDRALLDLAVRILTTHPSL